MVRLATMMMFGLLALVAPAAAQAPPGPAATPSDYVLLTVIMRHDQTKNLDEINALQTKSGFWAKFPPEGMQAPV